MSEESAVLSFPARAAAGAGQADMAEEGPGKVAAPQGAEAIPAPRPAALVQADPDDLARAIAALRGALLAERSRRPPERPAAPSDEAFSPVGTPRPRATWRAGSGVAPPAKAGRAGAAAGAVAPHGTASGPEGRDPLGRRILALWFPDLAIERHLREADRRGDPLPDDLPVALATEGAHGPVIHDMNRAARLAGVQPGARVVDMRALVPTLKIAHADPGGDAAALTRLMRWARRWCPWTAVEGTRGLVLDTTGSSHLWGGEARMLEEIEGRLATLGLTARGAIAPTLGAAWALARYGTQREICLPEGLAARAAPLPVRALRIDAATVQTLQRLGLKTVGDLAAVPRLSLARRFSREGPWANPLLRLDQMMGRVAEPVSSPEDPPRFAVQVSLAEPILDPVPHLPALTEELCAMLSAAGFGARRVVLTLYRTDGEVVGTTVATARASRDPRHLARLFDGRLDQVDPGFGFDLITLSAGVAEKLDLHQHRLDGRAEAKDGEDAELAALIDRLSARFGTQALRRPAPRESHIPERRADWVPAMTGTPQPLDPGPLERPLRLFTPPEEVRVIYAVPEGPPAQFVWRRVTHRVTRFAGPERIAPEWWTDRPGTRLRDYYRIEDHEGRRLWLYREGVMGDGRGEAMPRWFVHGAFG